MVFNPEKLEMMLSGSHVNFKKRERPPLSEEESKLKKENERKLEEGIGVLRKLRTKALEEQDVAARQGFLKEAHQFSSQMAEVIIGQALNEKPSQIDPAFQTLLEKSRLDYRNHDAGSGHGISAGYSINNLFRATDDMLVRIEEKAQSFSNPDHKLSQEEMQYVLQEFLIGTNNLTRDATDKFFAKYTKVGGILSGGSIYAEIVKKIVNKYADPSFKIETFVVAVDKENKKAVFEAGENDNDVQTVIVTDDMIDKGGTLLTALWKAGEKFPNAKIHSGLGTDQPGGFEKRRRQKHIEHLEILFQDFADFTEEKKNDEALALFEQAKQYAKDNDVNLPPGWYIRREKIGKSKARNQK